jgi:hypothetical protein
MKNPKVFPTLLKSRAAPRRSCTGAGAGRRPGGQRGQSLVELALVMLLLPIILLGIVEYGLMLNRYLNLLDAAREAARFGANVNPFDASGNLDMNFFVRPDTTNPPSFPANPPGLSDYTEDFMSPVVLDPARGDDIVISFFSVSGSSVLRFPDADGFSRYGNHGSNFTDAQISDRVEAGAPPTGILLIEVFYNYPQLLKAPFFTQFIPDPIPVYTYAIMPLSAAEPTAAP